jgi:hypothetical protein
VNNRLKPAFHDEWFSVKRPSHLTVLDETILTLPGVPALKDARLHPWLHSFRPYGAGKGGLHIVVARGRGYEIKSSGAGKVGLNGVRARGKAWEITSCGVRKGTLNYVVATGKA